jgi:cell division protein FtsQ
MWAEVAGVPEVTLDERPPDAPRVRRRSGTGWREAAKARALRFAAAPADDLPDPSPDAAPRALDGLVGDGPATAGVAHPASEEAPGADAASADASATDSADAADSADATDGSDAAPDIDPRIQQRRLDVEAEHGRRRRRALVLATSTVVAAALAFGVLRSPLLEVRRPRVSGEVQTPVGDVLRAAGLVGDPHMIDLNPDAATAAIERLPWIATARVRRSWPDTVIVTLTERTPAAVVGGMLVDATGRVLSVAPGFAPLVPVAADRGLAQPVLPPPGGQLPAAFRPGLVVATAIPPALRPRVGEVLVGPGGTVRLTLAGGASALLGDTSDLGQKLEVVLTLVDRVRIGTGTVDARVPSAPVLTS